MSGTQGTLHLVCGKIAAGKSTLCRTLADAPAHVLISEDAWLAGLHGPRMRSVKDYVARSAELRNVMGPHVSQLLRAGVSVVLDFPANTVQTRAWMRDIIETTGSAHVMHFLDVPDEVCLARLQARNASGAHEFAVTESQFRQVTRHFAPPCPSEGFETKRYDGSAAG